MRGFAWALALSSAAACGNVATQADAKNRDAPDPDALTCPGTQLACEGTCIDPMTTAAHCGSCDNTCQTAGSVCMAGHCVDNITSCTQIHMVNPAATTGFYNLLDGTQIFCDMVGLKGYAGPLLMAQFDSNPTGYTIISGTDLASSAGSAFVALYNQQGGLKVAVPWTSTNCCFKSDTTAVNNVIQLSASALFPAAAGVVQCNQAGGYLVATTYQFQITAGAIFGTAPLAADYFTTHPATNAVGCGIGANPAMFWKVIP